MLRKCLMRLTTTVQDSNMQQHATNDTQMLRCVLLGEKFGSFDRGFKEKKNLWNKTDNFEKSLLVNTLLLGNIRNILSMGI